MQGMRSPTAPRPLLGTACVLAAASLWGTTGTTQALAGGQLHPAWFGAGRVAFAALFFLLMAGATGGWRRSAWAGLPPGAALGAGLCMATYNLAFFAGVQRLGVGVGTAVALGSGPIWAGLLQAVVQRRAPSLRWWLATAVAVAGGVMLALGSGGGAKAGPGLSLPGLLLCLLAGLSYAMYTLLNQRMVAHASAPVITLAAFGVAALVAAPAAWLQAGVPLPTARDVFALAFTGMVSAGVAYLLFSHALHHISPATGVTLALAEPVVAFMLAVAVLGEPAGALSLAGLVAVVGGVLALVRVETAASRQLT